MASLKKSYRCSKSLQRFYTGGPVAVSSDGTFIACACDDKINIVDSSNASVRATLEGDTEQVTALTLSPDGKLLFSASHSRLIRVWDLSSSKCLRSWKGHEGPVMSMACDASGGCLVTGGADRKVQVWDVDGGFCTHYFKGHKGVVTCVMFHPDPNQLLVFSGSDDAAVRVLDLVSKKCVAVLEKHFSAVTSLAVSENGWTLLSAGRDKVVNVWDLRKYSLKVTVPTHEVLETVHAIHSDMALANFLGTHSSSKKRSASPPVFFLTVGERGIVRIWNSEGAVCLYEQQSSDATLNSDKDDSRRGFMSAVILPSDQGLLCVTADQQFLFYSMLHSAEGTLKLGLHRRLIGYNEDIVDLKFLGEEEKFVAVATNVEQVQVYDLASMSCSYVLSGHTDIVLCLDTCVTSAGRTLIATGSKDNNVRLWDAEKKCCIGVGIGHMKAVGAVVFSKKGGNFFVSGSRDRTIKVWSLDGLSEDIDHVTQLKAKATVAAHADDKDINSLAISPNDGLVCSGSQDHTACIWRLPELVLVMVLKGHKRGIWSVEFSPVDKCVLTSSGDKTIKIWSIADGSCLKTFEGHTASVLRASFITRGTQLVSCGADGLVKLWTVKSNECIATYDQHEDKIWALAVGKKTEMLATGGSDAMVNLWHDCTAAEKEEAFLKEEEAVLKCQELENAVSDVDYARAIQLAFELHRPHKLFDLFAELYRKRYSEDRVVKTLSSLSKEELHQLLEYIREWNTKPKLCHVAQSVLFQIFNMFPPTEIVEIKGISDILEGLIPYSQRHFSRMDRLVRSTYLLDYALTGMSVIDPEPVLHSKEEPVLPTNNVQTTNAQLDVIPMEEQERCNSSNKKEKSSKKRKSNKSKGGADKKLKEAMDKDVTVVPVQA